MAWRGTGAPPGCRAMPRATASRRSGRGPRSLPPARIPEGGRLSLSARGRRRSRRRIFALGAVVNALELQRRPAAASFERRPDDQLPVVIFELHLLRHLAAAGPEALGDEMLAL